MSEELNLASELDALAQALQGLTDASAPPATVLDVELAERWETLRQATVDFEARLQRWSQTVHESSLEEHNLGADARTLSDAWSAAQAHLKKGGALSGPLKEVAEKLEGARADGQAELTAALKYALRSFPPKGGPAPPPHAAQVDDHSAAEILALRSRLATATAEAAAAQQELLTVKSQLEKTRAVPGEPALPDPQNIALRAERDELAAELRKERAKKPHPAAAPENSKPTPKEEELDKELRRTKAKLAKLTAELNRK